MCVSYLEMLIFPQLYNKIKKQMSSIDKEKQKNEIECPLSLAHSKACGDGGCIRKTLGHVAKSVLRDKISFTM